MFLYRDRALSKIWVENACQSRSAARGYLSEPPSSNAHAVAPPLSGSPGLSICVDDLWLATDGLRGPCAADTGGTKSRLYHSLLDFIFYEPFSDAMDTTSYFSRKRKGLQGQFLSQGEEMPAISCILGENGNRRMRRATRGDLLPQRPGGKGSLAAANATRGRRMVPAQTAMRKSRNEVR